MTIDSQISEREREILRLVATGATNQQIANQLNISVNTVKVHLRNIFGKIGASSRTEATLYAVRAGLVPGAEVPTSSASQAAVVETAPPVEVVPPVEAAPLLDPEVVEPVVAERITNGTALERYEPTPLVVLSPATPPIRRRLLLGGALLVALLAVVALTAIMTRRAPTETPTATPAGDVVLPDADQRWHALAPMPDGRAGFALANYDYDGKRYLYVIAGEVNGQVSGEVVRYDQATNTWVPLSVKTTPVSDVQAVVVGNRIYVPGGRLQSGAISDTFEAYDPQHDRWTALKPLPQPRSAYALAAVEGKLYLFGGWDGSTYRADVWQYNPDQDSWSERTPMRTPRGFAGAAAEEGRVYVVGGEGKDGALNVNERYTPADDNGSGNPWTTQAPLPTPSSHMAAATTGGVMFVLSGTNAAGRSLVYNINLDSWQTREIPLGALRDLRAQAIGSKLYILGGRDDNATSAQAYVYQAIYNVLLPIKP